MISKFFNKLQKYLDEKQLQAIKDIHQTTSDIQKSKESIRTVELNTQRLLKEIEESRNLNASLNQRIDSVEAKFEQREWEKKAQAQSQSDYISMLASYTAHDLKNNLQNIDNILSFKKAVDITNDDLLIFKSTLKIIRESMDKFAELSLISQNSEISIKSVISNVLHINQQNIKDKLITVTMTKNSDATLMASFFTMTTIVNNLLINAINALSLSSIDPKLIYIDFGIIPESSNVYLKIHDNADEIPEELHEKIFIHGFTTRASNEGAGIGLSHVQDVCILYNGSVRHIKSDIIGYTKAFCIELPIRQD